MSFESKSYKNLMKYKRGIQLDKVYIQKLHLWLRWEFHLDR